MSPKDSIKAQEIGRRIVQARKEAGGMTQRELAELLGVTERSVIAYEHGDVIPYRFLDKLESALGRSAGWFLHGEETAVDSADKRFVEVVALLKELREEVQRLEAKIT